MSAQEIRSTHRYAYRSGQWARLVNTVEYGGRECYLVRFDEDGSSDWWVVDDPDAGYEFRRATTRPESVRTEATR